MRALVLAMLLVALGAGAVAAEVPSTISFSARLADDETGEALTGAKRVTFQLFAAATGGTAAWMETREVTLDEGLLFTALGETEPLDATVLAGGPLWLQVTVDGTPMEPRIAITSVPFAVRAGDADSLDGIVAEQLQQRIADTCSGGTFLTGVNADGSVVCAPDSVGAGDITDVIAAGGLEGGGGTGSVTLRLLSTCAPSQILKWSGTAWACAADAGSTAGTGDITSVTVGPAGGLAGGNTTGDVMLSLLTTCAPMQVLKWTGGSWACANDVDTDTDTNSGGDITAVTPAAGGGIQGGAATGDAALSLLTTCGTGQLLKWNGTQWACANDIDTNTPGGNGDITEVVAGAGLSGGAATGAATVNVVAGSGITLTGDAVGIDYGVNDARWVNATGDSMTGALDMNQQRLPNRGCPASYSRLGPGLCAETTDSFGHTFTGCANRCRLQGTHMCTSAETRAGIQSGVITQIWTGDWIDDQSTDGAAFFVMTNDAADPDGVRATSTSGYCRCCANVE